MSRNTIKNIVTPNGNAIIDEVNDAVRVNVVTGGGSSGTEYADGAARGTATGTLAMGDDGTNVQSVKVDTAGVLAVQDNGGSLTVDGIFGKLHNLLVQQHCRCQLVLRLPRCKHSRVWTLGTLLLTMPRVWLL